ncbi:DUF4097 family beta strand repeat-containing protein [Kitasatospora sp. NPDC006697]|uniref:DUF4097 family beta strand repeat-containing protein n=1 Tax=Kitasatospora sp. NPDC006697 TaxID=3364020 RepID=UPI0036890042
MTTEYRRWRVIGVVATVLLVLLGAGQAWRALAQQDGSENFRYTQRITALDLDLQNASARISPGLDGDVVVGLATRWTVDRPVVTREVVGQKLRITVRCPDVFPVSTPCSSSLTIGVPVQTSVTVRGSSADTKIVGLSGDLNLHAGSGSFELDDVTGKVAAQVTSGSVKGKGLASRQVQAQVTSGSADLSFISPPDSVSLSAGSGEVTAVLPRDSTYRIAVSTGSGGSDIDSGLQDASSPRTITATADSGAVTIHATPN